MSHVLVSIHIEHAGLELISGSCQMLASCSSHLRCVPDVSQPAALGAGFRLMRLPIRNCSGAEAVTRTIRWARTLPWGHAGGGGFPPHL
jgi:hypothetical protein